MIEIERRFLVDDLPPDLKRDLGFARLAHDKCSSSVKQGTAALREVERWLAASGAHETRLTALLRAAAEGGEHGDRIGDGTA